jgi:hypothetical protein
MFDAMKRWVLDRLTPEWASRRDSILNCVDDAPATTTHASTDAFSLAANVYREKMGSPADFCTSEGGLRAARSSGVPCVIVPLHMVTELLAGVTADTANAAQASLLRLQAQLLSQSQDNDNLRAVPSSTYPTLSIATACAPAVTSTRGESGGSAADSEPIQHHGTAYDSTTAKAAASDASGPRDLHDTPAGGEEEKETRTRTGTDEGDVETETTVTTEIAVTTDKATEEVGLVRGGGFMPYEASIEYRGASYRHE